MRDLLMELKCRGAACCAQITQITQIDVENHMTSALSTSIIPIFQPFYRIYVYVFADICQFLLIPDDTFKIIPLPKSRTLGITNLVHLSCDR